ncbi:MAG: tetratricopeptide repeat protein [Desulforhopalus sp.]
MSSESAYNKRLSGESTMDKVEGILEHFNLPPKVIDFIRKNKNVIIVVTTVVVVAIVSWALYDSYSGRMREEAASALSLARQGDPSGQDAAFRKVYEQYPNTSAALWARIEQAHLALKNGKISEASNIYGELLTKIEKNNPLYPLLLFGEAQALEGEKRYQDASAKYDQLKEFKGFEYLAYSGMGRLEEAQDNVDGAIAVYNNFLLAVADDPAYTQARNETEEKIARLKVR